MYRQNLHQSKTKMRLAIVIFCFLTTANVAAGQVTDKIASIRKTVEAINNTNGYNVKILDNDYFAKEDEVSDNGQELRGYYKNGQLKKIVYSLGLSNCLRPFEYYFSDTGLVFVFEKEADYPEKRRRAGAANGLDYSKLVPVFEGRYYIEKDKIIQSKIKGRTRNGNDYAAGMLNTLKDLMEDLKTAKAK